MPASASPATPAVDAPAAAAPPARRRRGRPRTLSRDRVVTAALAIAGEHGLQAVSLQAVAGQLGIADTSLYTYVESKDDLLAGMVDAVFTADLPLPADDDPRPPAEQLKAIFRELHRRARTHRELLAVLGRVPVTSTAPLAASERVAVLLSRLGIAPAHQVLVYVLLTQMVIADALTSEVGGGASASPAVLDAVDDTTRFAALAVLRAAAAEVVVPEDGPFEVVLDFLLDEVVVALAGAAR